MDANKLIIGMPYVYRAKNGKDMVVTFTDETYDGRYVFHTRGCEVSVRVWAGYGEGQGVGIL